MSDRAPNALRPITFTRHYTQHAEGSVLVAFGNTKVLCNASVSKDLPRFIREKDKKDRHGWVTAEYGMLPRATHTRSGREASRGKQGGRTMEIQRLIGRSLRSCVDLKKLGELSITIDCDVIQADGGTRTAAISGGCVALIDALTHCMNAELITESPLLHHVGAVSVGIVGGKPVLDLDYSQDSTAETDMNVVMFDGGGFIEIQGTAEAAPFDQSELNAMLDLARSGIQTIIDKQRMALAGDPA